MLDQWSNALLRELLRLARRDLDQQDRRWVLVDEVAQDVEQHLGVADLGGLLHHDP